MLEPLDLWHLDQTFTCFIFTEFVQTVICDQNCDCFIVSCWSVVAWRDQLIQEQLFVQQQLAEDEDERKVTRRENTADWSSSHTAGYFETLWPQRPAWPHSWHVVCFQDRFSVDGEHPTWRRLGLQVARSPAVGTRCQNMQHRISSSLMSLLCFGLSSGKIQLIQSKFLQIHLNGSCEDETISWLSAGVTSDLCDSSNVMKADETLMWTERWAWRSFRSQTDETLRNITHPARVHGDQPPPVAMAAAGGSAGHSQRSCEWIIVLLQLLKSDLSEPRAAEQHGVFQRFRLIQFSSSSWCLLQSSVRVQIALLPPRLLVVYAVFCHRWVFVHDNVAQSDDVWVLMRSCDEGKLQNMMTNINSIINTIWIETLRLAEKL